ncbi:hypothetical protein [Sphingopyxis sp. OAS728]|uniref:hypothetical protein n=1 Tax=Sphingopyxis sp. OAS728 TaxID=2663823 RepID=UPI00178B06A6|nr:hypothetical protein [Sphingopyxis sp. OAS728]
MMRRNMRRFTGVEPFVIDSALVDGAPTPKRRACAAFRNRAPLGSIAPPVRNLVSMEIISMAFLVSGIGNGSHSFHRQAL